MFRRILICCTLVFLLVDCAPYPFFKKMAANGAFSAREQREAHERHGTEQSFRCFLLQQSPFFWRRRVLTHRNTPDVFEDDC
uniref:Lipoprotein n=1 Tax=Steinernema glaseri TaxID=37863 RepID=A0A1I7YIX6_9BILA